MSRDVYSRFKEIVPDKSVDRLTEEELKKSVRVAFDVIGYTPNRFEFSFSETVDNFDGNSLFEFVYDVYWCDVQ